jgi:hypothetical protein
VGRLDRCHGGSSYIVGGGVVERAGKVREELWEGEAAGLATLTVYT